MVTYIRAENEAKRASELVQLKLNSCKKDNLKQVESYYLGPACFKLLFVSVYTSTLTWFTKTNRIDSPLEVPLDNHDVS